MALAWHGVRLPLVHAPLAPQSCTQRGRQCKKKYRCSGQKCTVSPMPSLGSLYKRAVKRCSQAKTKYQESRAPFLKILSYEQQWKKERETVYKSILQELDIILSGKGEKSPCLNPNMRFQQLLSKAKLHRVTNTKIEKAKTLFKKMRKFKAVHLRKRDSVDGLGEAEIRSCTNQAPGECLICYGEGEYRITHHCNKKHFYCRDCIRDTIKMTIDNGKYPSFCPACAAEQPRTAAGRKSGLIDEQALDTLVKSSLITERMKYRYIVGQHNSRNDEVPFCPCPNENCKSYLLMDKRKHSVSGFPSLKRESPKNLLQRWVKENASEQHVWKKYRPGICFCGQLICPACKQGLKEEDVEGHTCELAEGGRGVDLETFKLLKKSAKPCPNCGLLEQKAQGCDYMMCGTHSHGRILDAIANGGCGYNYSWETGEYVSTYFTGIDGYRKTGHTKDYLKEASTYYSRKRSNRRKNK